MLNIIEETKKKIDNDKKKVEAALIVTADCQRVTVSRSSSSTRSYLMLYTRQQ